MALTSWGSFGYSLHATLGLGVFTLPYLARAGGAGWTVLGLSLSGLVAVAFTRRIAQLGKQKKQLSEPLLETEETESSLSPAEATATVLPDAFRPWIYQLLRGLTALYFAQVALYSLDFLPKLLPTYNSWLIWAIAGTLLTYVNCYSLTTSQRPMLAAAGFKLALLVLAALVSGSSGQVELRPESATGWEVASMLPFFLCCGLYHLSLPLFSASSAHFLGVAAGLGALLGFSLWFELAHPEAPYFLPAVLQLWNSTWMLSLLALVFTLSTCYFHLRSLQDVLPSKQPLPLMLCGLLILRDWALPGPIEDSLLLNPAGAVLALGWMVLLMQGSRGSWSFYLTALVGTGLALALVDFSRGVNSYSLLLAGSATWLTCRYIKT